MKAINFGGVPVTIHPISIFDEISTNPKGRYKISVKVIKEFACANEHCKPNENYIAYEKEDKYIVRVHNFDIVVPKKIFTEFFEITNTES